MRFEIPWVKTFPSDLIRKHVRFTLQPLDAPPNAEQLIQTLEQLECDDLLLYSSDYPHWHDSAETLLTSLTDTQRAKIMSQNAQAFYRL